MKNTIIILTFLAISIFIANSTLSGQANCKTYTIPYVGAFTCNLVCVGNPMAIAFGFGDANAPKVYLDAPPPGFGAPVTSVSWRTFGACDGSANATINGVSIGVSTQILDGSCNRTFCDYSTTATVLNPPGYNVGGNNTFQVGNSNYGPCWNAATGLTVTVCYSSLSTVPTLGEWGLITFSMLLLSVCMVHMLGFRLSLGGFGSVSAGAGIPFDAPIYFKTLVAVLLVTSLCFSIFVNYFGYSLTDADVPGILINSPILAYTIHLWKMSKKN